MLRSLLRLASTAATVIVVLSFALFVIDEAGESAEQQRKRIEDASSNPDPTASQERLREREHTTVREAIDDANDVLVKPFAGIVDSDDKWVRRGLPALFAFLVYGLGLRFLANLVPGRRAREPGSWQEPPPPRAYP